MRVFCTGSNQPIGATEVSRHSRLRASTHAGRRRPQAPLGPAMQRLLRIATKPDKLIIGLISGTSIDGVDAALVRVRDHSRNTRIEVKAFATLPYPADLRAQLLDAARPGHGSSDVLCRLNVAIGEWFAHAAKDLVSMAGIPLSKIDLIGSHGQTLHHLPVADAIDGIPSRGTLQMGEPSVIAKRTGVITVADFRPADMAVGGQGAPLVPYVDHLLFASKSKARGVLNIGGIANLTVLKKDCRAREVVAFDTGPGNMVIDELMRELFGKDYDEGGRTAGQGSVYQPFLEELLRHSYFLKPPPKSTGREEFGKEYCGRVLAQARSHDLNRVDIIATVTALTAHAVCCGARLVVERCGALGELIVSGGGSSNAFLMEALRRCFAPVGVITSDAYGIPSDAKEAICFAVLANETVSGYPSNLPSVTGAMMPAVLGKICM